VFNERGTKSFSEHSNQANAKIISIVFSGEQNYSCNQCCFAIRAQEFAQKNHPFKWPFNLPDYLLHQYIV
jgi:hypothetical protein